MRRSYCTKTMVWSFWRLYRASRIVGIFSVLVFSIPIPSLLRAITMTREGQSDAIPPFLGCM